MFAFLAAEELLAVGMNHRMAPFLTTNGSGHSMICEGKFNLGSACIQRTAIDALNLLFLCLFYILVLFQSFTAQRTRRPNRRFSRVLTIVVSACCGLISISCFGSCLWDLAQQQHKDGVLVQLVRGLIWFSLTLSILVRKSRIVEILVIVWWVCFPLLLSALCVETLIQTHEIQIFYIVSWPTSLMLLICAFQSITNSCGEEEVSELVVPLIEEKGEVKLVNIEEANFYGKLIFSWINPLLSLGYSKPLSPEDIPSLSSKDESSLAYQKFSDAWKPAKLRSSKSSSNLVIKAITSVYWKEHVAIAICAFLRTVGVVALPLVLYAFVNYSNREESTLEDGLKILFCLIFLKLMESFSQRHWFFDSRRSGMRMRSALMVAVYEKQLKLSISGRRRHSTGEIVNYIAVDAYRMGEFPWWFHTTWSSTLQLFMSIAVLFFVVGLSALPGLIPLLICGLLNVPFARILQNCQSHLMASQDQRLRATSEILNSIKIIKLQAWEGKFRSLIENLRGDEFHWLSKLQLCRAYGGVLYWMSPTVVSSVVFTACAVFGTAPLDAGTIFTVLATLRAMGEPVRMIPEALSNLIQVKVSFHRINSFLLDDDAHDQLKNNEHINRTSSLSCGNMSSVKLESGNFSWDPEILDPTVKNVNLEVRNGQKFAVCGPVGAGKSSLLYAILGEIPKLSGTVNVNGSIAYVAQTSWIQSGTVRDNILYGRPMEEERYEKAIKACALDKDISSFDYGDLTEIGQRGINMSGGQKQRIQLARALYSDADIYLLDDPFSAVDAQTAAILFNECVMNALKKKTVILVTHQVEFLSGVDKILVMEGGKITQMGNYEELLSTGTPFEQLVNAHKGSVTLLGPFKHGVSERTETVSSVAKQSIEGEITVKCTPSAQLTEEEERVTGDVGWRPFIDYITLSKCYGNFLLSVIAVSGFVICQAGATYWLAFGSQVANISSSMLIGVYAGIAILSAVFTYFRSLFAAYLGLQGSKAFFSGFTDAIFKAPMLFFDSTPVGRILTRASSDMSILDFDIPYAMIFVITVVVELIASFIIMASITWQVLVVVILVLVGIKHIQAYYLATARELIRINGTTKAPVMNYAAETSLGVVTIRAFKMVDRFFKDYQRLVDKDASLFLLSNAAMEWLVIRVEALQNMTIFATAFFLILIPKSQVTPGLVGLSLSYALPLTGTQIFLSRWYCNLSNYIISVERIKQFMSIPAEPPAIIEERRPPSHWPSKGRIELHDLKIRYRPNAPTVLKGITCTFQGGSRIGVVGRTGSGKTTLISALFRLVEPAGGNILVDGVDICSIGLRDLRTKLSIIPQEPALFKGSVRTNLDPLGLYSDDDIWKTLEKCQLHGTISSLPDKLDTVVSDEGENWSAGQRQLFCLGRVLLKKNRILVLDEATASIDSTTDAILQRIIRQEFSECTVITVAHRVPTVIDSDMVMVLYFGEMVEYDQPAKLMKTNSSFSKLVNEYWSSCRRNSNQDFNSFHE